MTQVHLAVEVESTSKASAGVSYPPGKRRKNCEKCPKKIPPAIKILETIGTLSVMAFVVISAPQKVCENEGLNKDFLFLLSFFLADFFSLRILQSRFAFLRQNPGFLYFSDLCGKAFQGKQYSIILSSPASKPKGRVANE